MSKIVFRYPIISIILPVLALFTAIFLTTAEVNAQNSDKTKLLILHDQLSNDDSAFLQRVKNSLKQDLANLSIESFNFNDKTIAELDNQIKTEAACVLTLGQTSLHAALATRNTTPIFSTLVNKLELDKQIHNYRPFGVNLSGIYEEQSFGRQLLLVKALSSETTETKNILLILGRNTRYDLPKYRQLIASTEFSLRYRILSHQTSSQDFLNIQDYKSGTLIILNDYDHYSSQNLKLLLLASYEKQIPMIGSTLNHAKLAAIASVYTSQEQLAIETSNRLRQTCKLDNFKLKNTPVAKAQFAKNYQVKVNHDIAKYFGLSDLNESELKEIMTQLEENSTTNKSGSL